VNDPLQQGSGNRRGEAVPSETFDSSALDAPVIVVTTDSHIGPRLKDDLRPYCPKEHLEEYDEFIRAYEPFSDPTLLFREFAPKDELPDFETRLAALQRNATEGHHDLAARLRDMDRDGVAAEVIYHGSQNGQCFPFINPAGGTFNAFVFSPIGSAHELELAKVGQRMYNQWLADQCSQAPERCIGLAHLPMWDIEAATVELERAHDAGLRGVNFPAPKLGITPYDDLRWERFWAICEERGMVLSTHEGSAVDDVSVHRPHTPLVAQMEELHRKVLPRLIFSGIFERYPKLRIALTELQQPTSLWWNQTAERYDVLWEQNRSTLAEELPRPPSEYLRGNVFLGQSLLHAVPSEVAAAVRDGYSRNVMWGSDYPHQEGVYRKTESDQEETRTWLGLRSAFSEVAPEEARAMVGENAIAAYGLDHEKLSAVAQRINAITLRRLGTPLDEIPEEWRIIARAHVFPEYRELDRRAAAMSRS
jgi:predicted TIM-barrel fold metal-dependent hydrolase